MNRKPPDKNLREFYLNANRSRMRLAVKQISTYQEACNILGVEVPRRYNPDSAIDTKQLNRVIKLYERWYFRKGNFSLPRKVVKDAIQKDLECIESSQGSSEDNDIQLPERNPKQVCELYPFQLKLAKSIYKAFLNGDYGALLRMNVGDGKTYVFGQVIRWLYDSGWIAKHKQFAPFPVCVFTKASIVEQTSRDLESEFGLQVPQEVLVINYEALRSKFGAMFIEEKTKVVYGEVVKSYHWRPFLNPIFVVLDEYQCLKNTDSTQSEIIQALNEVGMHDADSIVKANAN